MIQNQVCDECKALGKTNPAHCPSCIELHIKYAESMGKPSPIKTYHVSCSYLASSTASIELPLYKDWDDIVEWFIRYDNFNYRFKGETHFNVITMNQDIECHETKEPYQTTIFSENYEEELAER